MLNVKKFRATTTREALELIKRDLGEDAFVLETKRVKTGGFLGFRSSMQVEVSAAAAAVFSSVVSPAAKETTRPGVGSNRILNLTDDTVASPRSAFQTNNQKNEIVIPSPSLSADPANDFESKLSDWSSIIEPRNSDAVEDISRSPRIVYRQNIASPPAAAEMGVVVTEKAPIPPGTTSKRELELLRAEMREVKFSLGAFANRQNSQGWENEIDLDIFGDVFDTPFHGIYLELTGVGIPPTMARQFVSDIVPLHKNRPVAADHLTRATLLRALATHLKFEPDSLRNGTPVVMALIGPTGVGKTTTIAKLAARVALHEHRRVELVTLDTYRIAAVEQLRTYAEIIGAGCHVVRSVADLDTVMQGLPSDATVLIDTTGRSPHDLADQYELSDYLRGHTEIRKCLAIQATTHPIDALAAITKFEMYGADCLAVTKIDESMRPGAVIETIANSGLPLAYFCTGQRVPEDLQTATAESLTDRIIGKNV